MEGDHNSSTFELSSHRFIGSFNMTSPPHHSRNADATENLIAGFGSITVADRPFQSAPLPPDYHSLSSNEHHPAAHTPTQSRTPFSLPTSKEAVLYSSGQQPALGPAFTPVPTPHHGPLYPYGGRPPDLTSHIGSPQDVFYYHEESNSHQQPQNWANQSVAHKHRGELHHFVQSPTGSTNNVPFGSPHMFNTPEQLAIQHHHYQADNTHFQAVQSEAQAQWMGRQQGMYTGGERRQEAQVSRVTGTNPAAHCADRFEPQYPFSQTPATRPLRQSIPNDYPPQSDYHVSPYLGHLAPATPDLPSFQPVHYPSGVHHPLSPNPLDFASHTPLSPMRTGHRHLTMDPHRPRWSQKLEDFRLNRVGRKWEFKVRSRARDLDKLHPSNLGRTFGSTLSNSLVISRAPASSSRRSRTAPTMNVRGSLTRSFRQSTTSCQTSLATTSSRSFSNAVTSIRKRSWRKAWRNVFSNCRHRCTGVG